MRGARRLRLRRLLILLLAALLAVSAMPLLARVGGGEGYSGGGGSDGGGDVSAELLYLAFRFLFWLTINYPAIGIPVDIVVLIFVIRWLKKRDALKKSGPTGTILSTAVTSASRKRHALGELRKFDPNFSEVVFTDFCYSLYARAHHARGEGKLGDYAAYLSDGARATLAALGTGDVEGIVIGSFSAGRLSHEPAAANV